MKQVKNHSKLIVSLILAFIAVVCVCNVAYSYFTTSTNAGSSVALGTLNARFVYKTASNGSLLSKDSTTLELYSASGTIERGVAFDLSLTNGGAAIDSLGIQNRAGSCEAYVRFWIDAYVVTNNVVDKTVNYGKYFKLETSDYYTNQNSSVAGSSCYFGIRTLYPDDSSALEIGNSLILEDFSATDKVPVELLGEKLQISITFEAVQKANRAFVHAFGELGDTKGYYTSWS